MFGSVCVILLLKCLKWSGNIWYLRKDPEQLATWAMTVVIYLQLKTAKRWGIWCFSVVVSSTVVILKKKYIYRVFNTFFRLFTFDLIFYWFSTDFFKKPTDFYWFFYWFFMRPRWQHWACQVIQKPPHNGCQNTLSSFKINTRKK